MMWAPDRKTHLGVAEYSYNLRNTADRSRGVRLPFNDPLTFLDYCHRLGAGGIQVAIGSRDADYVAKLRAKAESTGMFLEGSIRLPVDQKDVERFENELRAAKDAGASVLRTVMLIGRRYETFDTADAFKQFAERSWKSLTLAEPVVSRHRMRLAVENHKDWRIPEMLAMLKRISSEFAGVCIDTGNSIALLEDPMEVVEAFAPWAYAVHIKDMAVQEYPEGFLLSEVPLGEGFLDLPKMIQTLRQAKPQIQFTLEMITRDPLKVPCLTKKYWATFDGVPGSALAKTLAMVREKGRKGPMPTVSGLDEERKLKIEDDNVRQCLAYARERLQL